MKKLMTLTLAAGMVLTAVTGANAIDFKAKGQWLMGFSAGDGQFIREKRDGNSKHRPDASDVLDTRQRVHLQLEAVASESLSGTVFFEIGDQLWGQGSTGGALGADGNIVEVKRAYLDWFVPNTALSFRMGIQGMTMPNAAGGSAVLDDDGAGITASYKINDNVALTAVWTRLFNDNWNSSSSPRFGLGDKENYHDNVDMFALILPLTFNGVKVTPWAMYGMIGDNAWDAMDNGMHKGSYPPYTLRPYPLASGDMAAPQTGKAYGAAFWAGLPISLSLWDPLNIELDINYGYVEAMGRYDATDYSTMQTLRGGTKRDGWLIKALVEYKMDWGTPGIFGWYSSGDDGNVKNGSERMPTLSGCANFMSFMGDGNLGWGDGRLYDKNLTYAGTWGIGLRVHDVSFVEDLKHSFRVAYWGGTNSPSMVKYISKSYGWNNQTPEGPYLTTRDGLLEFNFVNDYQVYDNLRINLELGYVVNMVDNDTWKRSYRNDSYARQDAWKTQLTFIYAF